MERLFAWMILVLILRVIEALLEELLFGKWPPWR